MLEERCGAQLRKKPGIYCTNWPMQGKKRCRLHGGKTPRGIASGSFKHGRYSRVLPSKLLSHFSEAEKDPSLLTHAPELCLLDTRLAALIENLEKVDAHAILEDIREKWQRFQRARRDPTLDKVQCLELVERAIMNSMKTDDGTWEKIVDLVESRRRTLESEVKRLQGDQHLLDPVQLLSMVEMIADIVRTYVTRYVDRELSTRILTHISNDLETLVGGQGRPEAQTIEVIQ